MINYDIFGEKVEANINGSENIKSCPCMIITIV